MANDPGWYPDPWRPGRRRWWDGTSWTDHTWDPTAPPPPSVAAAPSMFAPDPRRDLRDEANASMWAKRGYIAFVVGRALGFLLSIVVFSQFADHAREVLDTGGRVQQDTTALSVVNPLCSLVSLLGFVAIIIWSYKAATVAGNLHYPAVRSPVWAVVGWIIPVVNFWFPYQAIRDCLAPDNPERRTVILWWAFFLASTLVWLPAMILALFGSLAIAYSFAVPAFLFAAMELSLGRRVIDAVEADHAAAINRLTSA
ncbi:MAG TPA: DUF4328 domain-containing protein [Acidimicrobiales bacterium]|nr:DUF4328 domain-containing protein [Acidimicrobiales bacterium]